MINSLYKGHDRIVACSSGFITGILTTPLTYTDNFNWTFNKNIFPCNSFYTEPGITYFLKSAANPPAHIYSTTDFVDTQIVSNVQDPSNTSIGVFQVHRFFKLNGVYMFIGYGVIGFSSNTILYGVSTTLNTWKISYDPFIYAQRVTNGIITVGNQNVSLIVGYSPQYILISSDGLNWNRDYTLNYTQGRIQKGVFGNNRYVYLFFDSNYIMKLFINYQGSYTFCEPPYRIQYNYGTLLTFDEVLGKFVIAYEKGRISYSDDACTWKTESLGLVFTIEDWISTPSYSMVVGEKGVTLRNKVN